jgi:hypothetical protein
VAYFAGAETMKETGSLSPMTLLLNVTNVDIEKAQQVDINTIIENARKKYPLIPKRWKLSIFPSNNYRKRAEKISFDTKEMEAQYFPIQ